MTGGSRLLLRPLRSLSSRHSQLQAALLRQAFSFGEKAGWQHCGTAHTFGHRLLATVSGARKPYVPVWQWPYTRKVIRAVRVVVLTGGVFSFGYAAGEMEASSDPEGHHDKAVRTVLRQVGGWNYNSNTPRLLPSDSPEVEAVASVMPKILAAAYEEVCAMQAALLEESKRSAALQSAYDAQVERLNIVKKQLRSEWSLQVLDVDSVNAFVSSMVPRTVFVFKGIFRRATWKQVDDAGDASLQVGARVRAALGAAWRPAEVVAINDTDRCQKGYLLHFLDGSSDADECVTNTKALQVPHRVDVVRTEEQLAMLLAHELSHAIHGHLEDRMRLLAIAAGFQLVLLSILDPLGLTSFVMEAAVPGLAKFALTLPFSRANELEADATGLRICARAGYDPDLASQLVERLKATSLPGEDVPSWVSTHPSYDRRSEELHHEEVARELYKQSRLRR